MVSVWRLASTSVDEPVRHTHGGEVSQTTEPKSEDVVSVINVLHMESDGAQDQTEIGEGQNSTDTRSDIESESDSDFHSDADSNSDPDMDLDAKTDSDTHSQPISTPRSTVYPLVSGRPQVSCIQEAQLSPDGTCIFTSDYERNFLAYFLPANLWGATEPQPLKPYAQNQGSDPIWAFTSNPYYDSNNPETCTVLVSRRDKYINLYNTAWNWSPHSDRTGMIGYREPASISHILASYKLVDNMTEAVIAPSCLAFSNCGAYFYAGGKNRVDVFDLTYTDKPIQTIPTIPSVRTKLKNGGRGFKGHLSALSISPSSTFYREGIVAAGSRNRFVGLYDAESGSEITSFALPAEFSFCNNDAREYCGTGITQLKWSADGNYLYIAERMSDAILIYDHRKFSMALGYCAGRAAITRQKLGIDIWSGHDSFGSVGANHEVWAGGTDGHIRIWRDPHLKEGKIEADDVVRVGNGPVVSPLVHSCGYVAAVASGALERPGDVDDKSAKDDPDGPRHGKAQGNVFTRKLGNWGCLDVFGLS